MGHVAEFVSDHSTINGTLKYRWISSVLQTVIVSTDWTVPAAVSGVMNKKGDGSPNIAE